MDCIPNLYINQAYCKGMGEIMYIETRCPVHSKQLYGNGQTSTHHLFKCPDCDYSGGDGAVREDLPERYNELEAENKRLKEALKLTIDRWRLIGRKIWDTKVKVSILELGRQLEKDVEEILKG